MDKHKVRHRRTLCLSKEKIEKNICLILLYRMVRNAALLNP